MKRSKLTQMVSFILMLSLFFGLSGNNIIRVEAAPSKQKAQEFKKIIEPYRKVVDEYFYNANINTHQIIEEVIKASNDKMHPEALLDSFTKKLNDPYAEFFTEKELQSFNESMKGEFYGIGVQVNKDKKNGGLYIDKVFKGSPAEEAGLKKHDIIIKVANKKVTKMKLQDAIKLIKGEKGSKVKIVVQRTKNKKAKNLTFYVERREIIIPTVNQKFYKPEKVGYIKVDSFLESTDEDFIKAVDSLEQKGMKSLIVDLRGNGGGYVDTAENMLNRILPDKKLMFRFETAKGSIPYDTSTPTNQVDKVLDHPIIILMDKFSASASEIFAGALKDHNVAKIYGQKSYGKGVAQNIFEVNDSSFNGGIKFTVYRYLLPLGESIDKKGIEPDKKLSLKKDKKGIWVDYPLKEALNQLKKHK